MLFTFHNLVNRAMLWLQFVYNISMVSYQAPIRDLSKDLLCFKMLLSMVYIKIPFTWYSLEFDFVAGDCECLPVPRI